MQHCLMFCREDNEYISSQELILHLFNMNYVQVMKSVSHSDYSIFTAIFNALILSVQHFCPIC